MLPKSKYPALSRAHRRHPKRLARAMNAGGTAPSALLQTLLIREGYWPENDLLSVAAGAIEQIKREQKATPVVRPQGKSFAARAWGKVKSFFGGV